MEFLNDIANVFNGNMLINVILVPFLMCAIVYAVYKKRDAFGRDAVQNTAATLLVGCMNFGVAWLFYKDINAFAQSAYDALRIPTLPETLWTSAPLWLVCIIGIVAKDFVDYWNHRLMHTRWAWPTHAAHHSDTHVNAFTAYRIHFFEAVLMSLSYILLLTWMQIPHAIPVVVMLSSIHNMYVHMDLDYDHGRLKYLIASPVFHRWHHADVPEAHGKNIANVMPLWDVLFGTYYYPGICREKMGALESGIEDKNPLLIYIYPIQEWTRLVRAKFGGAPREVEPAQSAPLQN
ncbi:sterol desaturase family protein [uncultured Tateyamaria sp.]|uniref:sterol desaturase family protein n=1 Tax=uncultured Tateyamaria sp. TaxID=455651 RepID=UPI002608EFCD|nr:sterol desaturase family protein [uncultured Tateyamaria sp.]